MGEVTLDAKIIEAVTDHWRAHDVSAIPGYMDPVYCTTTHGRIHALAQELLRELGEQPMEGRTADVCDFMYKAGVIFLEGREPWLKTDRG